MLKDRYHNLFVGNFFFYSRSLSLPLTHLLTLVSLFKLTPKVISPFSQEKQILLNLAN